MKTARLVSAAAVVALAGQALGQPVIDGIRDKAFYGSTPIWVQTQATGFGDNTTVICNPSDVGAPGAVLTGVELAIPLSAIGNPTAANIRIAGFINSGDHTFVSNQAVGGMPAATLNLGEPRNISFPSITGNQFVGGILDGAAPVMDGTRDAAYGAARFTQTVRTGFGDSNTTTPAFCNGSEMDALYAVVSGGVLYVMVTGNLESNNNKLDLFIDVNGATTGQNQLAGDNPLIFGGGGLNRMGDDLTTGAIEGLTFDAGFAADYYVSVGGQDQGGGVYGMFVDYARLKNVSAPADPGVGYYCGLGTAQSPGTLTGGEPGAPAILATINNSNTAGVGPTCPPPAGNPDVANGSEIDSVYGRIFNGKLYLLVTGNVQTNFNKLSLFFDIQPGGQNRLRQNNPNVDFGGLKRMGDDGTGNGLKFDTDFTPDYWIGFTNGLISNAVNQFSNASVLRTDGMPLNINGFPLNYEAYDGGVKSSNNPIPWDGPLMDAQTGFVGGAGDALESNYAPRSADANLNANPPAPTPPPAGLLRMTIDNSNLLGVTATSAAGAALVTTGLELEITLPELTDSCTGACTVITSVKVAGFISNGGYSFLSNQVIGGLGPALVGNLGEPRVLDFSTIADNQYITITAPATCYANCDSSTIVPCLNVQDFGCFLNKFAAGDTNANCDNSTISPVLNVQDFGCFLNKFAAGCSAC